MAKSIKFKNDVYLDSTGIRRDIITLAMSSSKSGNTKNNIKVPFDNYIVIGTKLSLVNNQVKIGKNIKKVMISGACFIDTSNSYGYLWLSIQKNNNWVASNLTAGDTTFKSCSIVSRVIDVKEGDLIGLYIDNTGGTPYTIRSGHNTYLTVEVVE